MTEKQEKYDTSPKNLNALKRKYELRGGDWKEALEKVKEATSGKDIATAMKEGWKLEDFVKLLLDGGESEAPKSPSQEPAQEAPNFGFTEAPTSFNVKAISPQGFDVMLTLRDADTKALIDRVEGALTWLSSKGFQPTGRRGGGNGGNAQANSANQGEAPLCPTHGKAMRASKHKEGEWYCPVKIAEDDGTGKPVYCKQKVKE